MARNRYDVSRIMVNGKDVFTLQLRMSALGHKQTFRDYLPFVCFWG